MRWFIRVYNALISVKLVVLKILVYLGFSTMSKHCTLKLAMSTCVARYDKALTTDPVVMRSSPATGHIRCALLANQSK